MTEAGAVQPDEVRSLRRGMRDLVALSTLPAVWGDSGPDRIAESLADVLVGMVDLEILLVRVTTAASTPSYDAIRAQSDGSYSVEQVRALANTFLRDPGDTQAIPDMRGTVHVVWSLSPWAWAANAAC